MSDSYKKAGVSEDAAEAWVEHIARMTGGLNGGTGGGAGAKGEQGAELRARLKASVGHYAAVYAAREDHWVAVSCDGVGTKLMWTEQGLGRYEDLAQDLIAMNANDVLCVGGDPVLFLDYLAVGSADLLKSGLKDFLKGLVRCCSDSGQLLVGGETAQMPDLYEPTHFDLAGFSVGFLKPDEFLGVDGLLPGLEVWGWPSSGPHSNGFTLLRKLFDQKKDADFIRTHLMPPTRLYVNEFRNFRRALNANGKGRALKAAFHITGGGLLNAIRQQPPNGAKFGMEFSSQLVAQELASYPKWFQEVARRSGASLKDLFSTFNAGWGMLMCVDPGCQQLCEEHGLIRLGSTIAQPVVRVADIELR